MAFAIEYDNNLVRSYMIRWNRYSSKFRDVCSIFFLILFNKNFSGLENEFMLSMSLVLIFLSFATIYILDFCTNLKRHRKESL